MSRVLIAGCGYVGGALAGNLAAGAHTVYGLRRTPANLPSGVLPVVADLLLPETLQSLPDALDAVVYAASASDGGEGAYRAAYVDGVRNLLDALRVPGRPFPRFIFTSSTGVYAESGGEWVDETTPVEATRPAARALVDGETLVRETGAPGVVVRFSGIYGPGRTRLLRLVRDGEARRPRRPFYTNRIHREDCAGVLQHLLDMKTPPDLVVATDLEPADLGEVYRWVAETLGVPVPPLEETERGSPFPGGGSRGHKRCRNRRLLDSGYRFRYPTFREGYRALVSEVVDEP